MLQVGEDMSFKGSQSRNWLRDSGSREEGGFEEAIL